MPPRLNHEKHRHAGKPTLSIADEASFMAESAATRFFIENPLGRTRRQARPKKEGLPVLKHCTPPKIRKLVNAWLRSKKLKTVSVGLKTVDFAGQVSTAIGDSQTFEGKGPATTWLRELAKREKLVQY